MEALVAGHVCLDIIPDLQAGVEFEPGRLVEAGPATLSTGGAVSNTGLALCKLGVETRLMGKIGIGPFGRSIKEILESHQPGSSRGMLAAEGQPTSYTIVLNLSGQDRMFLHFPGSNDTFSASDVPEGALREAKLFHFGYPPIMAGMHANCGEELVKLLARAKQAGCMTSLDMSLPDPTSASGRADWNEILRRSLPYVDLFLPSIEELMFMLDRQRFEQVKGAVLSNVPARVFRELAHQSIALGAKVVGIKAGARGLYLKATEQSIWPGVELWAPCFKVNVSGTTGAGDATIAGLLMAILRDFSPPDAVNAAVAVGACCCEQPDAISGVRSWPETESRILSGWERLDCHLGEGWRKGPNGVFQAEQ